MVKKGRELSPLMRTSAALSSALVTVFSVNGMPRLLSSARPEPQGAQLLAVYKVTGYLLAIWRNSNGSPPPPAPIDLPPAPMAVVLLDAAGGLSEKEIFPSS